MAANKKRKLGEGSGNSTPTMMSAFAARQQLWRAAASRNSVPVEKATPEPPAPADEIDSGTRSGMPSARSGSSGTSRGQSCEGAVQGSAYADQTQSVEGEKGSSGTNTPRPESQGITVRQHSSFRPNKKNFQRKAGGRIVLTTPEPERLVILGSYGVKVREGEVTVAGAILTAADGVQWVHAPHCHALPVLRTADDTVLELQPHPTAKGLRQLAKLNPAFAKIWNETHPQEPGSGRARKSPDTFQIIYTSEDVPKRAFLQELVSPAEWNKKLSGLASVKRKGTPVIFLCGPKSSGKSTFGRVLANRLMTDRGGVKSKAWSSVMVLDVDPGQPEYSPPGVISLCKTTAPNLSPSFCHPTLAPTEGQQLRAHAIASVTPALDPVHFIECVLDLFNHYRRSPDAKLPLVINTPGWIQGTGLDILAELITAIRPTEVVYMSQDGPEETVNTLQSACATISPPTPFSTLPSQPSDISSRTGLHFRTMQTMSYFHLRQPSQQQQQQQYTTWDPTPLTELRPWRVRYAGAPHKRGFLGVLCYDHQPAPELLAEAINGTVLALVKAESRAAFRDLLPPSDADTDTDPISSPDTPKTFSSEKEESSERIPLIPNPQGRTLDPRHSHLRGLVLVRGIDTQRKELQLLTPLGSEVVAGLAGEETLLVAGRFDTPSWAYSEALYRRAHVRAHGEEGDSGSGSDSEGGAEGDDSRDSEESELGEVQERVVFNDGGEKAVAGLGSGQMEKVPWVEMLHGGQKRAVGSKVWRVRRDLGRN